MGRLAGLVQPDLNWCMAYSRQLSVAASLLRIAAPGEACRWKRCRNLAKRLWGRMLSAFLRGKGESYAVRGASQEASLVAQPGVDKMQRVRVGHSDGS